MKLGYFLSSPRSNLVTSSIETVAEYSSVKGTDEGRHTEQTPKGKEKNPSQELGSMRRTLPQIPDK